MGGKTSYQSIKQYEDKTYDKVLIRMPKGRKAEIQSRAESNGQSVNAFINSAIEEKINHAPDVTTQKPTSKPVESGDGYYNAELFEAIREAVKQHGGDLLGFIDDSIKAHLKAYPSIMKLKSMESELYSTQKSERKRVGIEEPEESEKQEDSFSNLGEDEIMEKFREIGRLRNLASKNDDSQKE